MPKISIARRFCGPPTSGNGGYVGGLLTRNFTGVATAVLRAPIPLDAELELLEQDGETRLLGSEGGLIAEGRTGAAEPMPEPPAPPDLSAAQAAGEQFRGLSERFHPICFVCSHEREAGDALRVFVGQVEGAPAGHVAGDWTPDSAFANGQGLIPNEIVWAALDCPGYFAWVEAEGRHGALLGTMSCDIKRPPRAGEACIVTAWPIAREGRKEIAGAALFTADGELLAVSRQVWIVFMRQDQAHAIAAGRPA